MKTNRTSPKASASRAAKQAATQPAEFTNTAQILMVGHPQHEDMLWAADDGKLFLHTGQLNEAPRPVTLAQAREWCLSHTRREIEPPFYPERSDARAFIEMVSEARQEKVTSLRVDAVVDSAFALIELMEYPLTKEDDSTLPDDRKQAFTNGIINLTALVQNQLLAFKEDYRSAMKAGAQ